MSTFDLTKSGGHTFVEPLSAEVPGKTILKHTEGDNNDSLLLNTSKVYYKPSYPPQEGRPVVGLYIQSVQERIPITRESPIKS